MNGLPSIAPSVKREYARSSAGWFVAGFFFGVSAMLAGLAIAAGVI